MTGQISSLLINNSAINLLKSSVCILLSVSLMDGMHACECMPAYVRVYVHVCVIFILCPCLE